MKVSDVMTRNVECTRPDATLTEAAARMKALEVGSLPVCENNRPVGVLTDRDIVVRCVAEGHDCRQARVADAMSRQAFTCFDSDDVADAAEVMHDKQVRRLLVLDSAKRLVGILSLGDVAVESGAEELAGHALEGISEPASPTR